MAACFVRFKWGPSPAPPLADGYLPGGHSFPRPSAERKDEEPVCCCHLEKPTADFQGLLPGDHLNHEVCQMKLTRDSCDAVQRGLENDGMNHCFLNCIIQALWSLRSFRERFLRAPEHEHSDRLTSSRRLSGRDGKANAAALAAASPRRPSSSSAREDASSAGGSEDLPDFHDSADHCCYCALKWLLAEYRFTEASTLPPDALRMALSNVYTDRGRFKLGEMEDATETIEVLLDILHASSLAASASIPPERSPTPEASERCQSSSSFSSLPRNSNDSVPSIDLVERVSTLACHPPCIAHEVFGLEYVDLPRCSFCHATGEPTVTSSYLYRVYVAELLAELGHTSEASPSSGSSLDALSAISDSMARMTARFTAVRYQLQDLLWKLCQHKVAEKCPECNSRLTLETERWLTRRPRTFVLSMVWPSAKPTRDQLWMVMSTLQSQVWMEQIFRTDRSASKKHHSSSSSSNHPSNAGNHALQDAYMLCGIICYYGMHYIAIFWNWTGMKWNLFDDTSVRGEKDWSSVVDLILTGQYVPTLLFYENLEGQVSAAQLEEFSRQVAELEDRGGSCSVM